jgi:hypothetical protein
MDDENEHTEYDGEEQEDEQVHQQFDQLYEDDQPVSFEQFEVEVKTAENTFD